MLDFIKKILKPITDVVGEVVVDRDKKKEIEAEIEKRLMEFALSYEGELTSRHQADMMSDSWLSKNIRPLTLIFLTGVFAIITFFDGNIGGFQINTSYIPVYQTLLVTVFSFYFGGRSLEKVGKMWKKTKEN